MALDSLRRLAEQRPLVLGSGSPRRVSLLSETGVYFTQTIPTVNEAGLIGETPIDFAQRLAAAKAVQVSSCLGSDNVVIGADTTVVLDDQLLGKPRDEFHALQMLKALCGRSHVVYTALSLARDGRTLATGIDDTVVHFFAADEERLKSYIATGEPMDKAGAYGIQGMGAFLVDRIEGCLDTVIGLPRILLDELAGQALENLG